MSKLASFTLMLTASLCLTLGAFAADKAKLKCPVSGHEASKDHAVAYKAGEVYFCCDDCPKAFKATTEKFAAKANHQLVASGQYKETKCPLTGKPLNNAMTAKVSGVTVKFCCGGCKAKVAKAAKGDEKIDLVFNDKAFDKNFEKVADAKK